MKTMIRFVLLALVISAPVRAEDQAREALYATADKVREQTDLKESQDRQIEKIRAQVRAKKEIIRERERLISKLESDQRAEDKLAARDQGAGREAREARQITARDRQERRQAQAQSLELDRKNLAKLHADLDQAEKNAEQASRKRDQLMKQLRAEAEHARYESYCQAGMGDQYKPASRLRGLFRNFGKTDAEKYEAEVQRILLDAQCVPSEAVTQRRSPKERSTEESAPSSGSSASPAKAKSGASSASSAAAPAPTPAREPARKPEAPSNSKKPDYRDPYSATSAFGR